MFLFFYCFNLETSSSDNPVMSATTSADMPLSSIFFATSAIPSARPPANFVFSAVLIAFTMSRYAFMLSSYSFCSCWLNFAIYACSKRRVKTRSCNAAGRCISFERFFSTNIHLSYMVTSSVSFLSNLGIST